MPESAANDDSRQTVVFFDGVCGLCNHTVNFLLNIDRRGVLRFAPLQGKTAEQIVPQAVREKLDTFVVCQNGRLFYRSTAFVRIMMQLGICWRIAGGVFWLIPWPLRDLAYRLVSRIRYRLFGRHETCRLPTPDERSRFLD
ncbi:MAG: DCC1-like thiol-disulfide oxidoreductase family protein [Planctomycetaceae bacterium]